MHISKPASILNKITQFGMLISLGFWSFSASAQPLLLDITVHADIDSQVVGCEVDFPNLGTTLSGIDRQLRATIDREAKIITDVRIADCDGGSFIEGPVIATDIPVALNEGMQGEDVIEMAARIDDFLLNSSYTYLWVSAVDPRTGSEDLTDEPFILFLDPVAVPTLGTWALILAALLLLATGYVTLKT